MPALKRITASILAGALGLLSAASVSPATPLSPESQRQYNTVIKPFLEARCYKCHNDKKTRAGFRIDTLGTDFLADKTADNWKEIYDKMGLGKMPPEKEPRPTLEETRAVTDWIDQEIRNAERLARNSAARTRRLNRTEYFNTLRDLFFLDDDYVRSLEAELPPDGKVDGFDRVGTSLYIDQAQLAKYVELADRVLSERVLTAKPKPPASVKDFAKNIVWRPSNQDGRVTPVEATERYAAIFGTYPMKFGALPTGARIFEMKNGGIEYLAGGKESLVGLHDFKSASTAGAGNWAGGVYSFFSKLTQDGKYRMKFRAGAFRGTGKYAVDDVKLDFEFSKGRDAANADRGSLIIDAPLDKPRDYEIDVYLHPHPEIADGIRFALMWNGAVAYRQERVKEKVFQSGMIIRYPEIYDFEWNAVEQYERLMYEAKKKGLSPAKIDEMFKAYRQPVIDEHSRIVKAYFDANKPAYVYNPEFDLKAVPRLFMESWAVEGPIIEWPPKGRTQLFFAGEDRAVDEQYMREIFARFLPRAYRRAIEPKELDKVMSFVLAAQKEFGLSGTDAVREGVKAVLCSPDFLMIEEPTQEAHAPQLLADHELASRLSYFLWSTMPDEPLMSLAASHKLHEPATLSAQVRRMIADPRAEQFVRNFAGQWLQVRDFGKTQTDRYQYKNYTDELQRSSWREPYEFFGEVLRSDLSIINFLDSDFLVVDRQLADFYGLDGVKEADGFKKVAIKPESHRGGVLGMAGVMTYLTDGLRTLPVRRAAYVKDVLWNEPAKPPPPNAGDLPPVKGMKLTVRQRLQQHRDSPSCGSCHTHLDPFGMALENFDAIGQWRDRQNGEGLKGDAKSPALDVSGELPSGRAFNNLAEYKQALLAEKDHFIRGFTMKMMTYALGRSVGATDRQTIDAVIAGMDNDGYRMQSLLQAIVATDAFRMK